MSKTKKIIIGTALAIIAMLAFGWFLLKIAPSLITGGCFGNTRIRDFKMSKDISCLSIIPNDCNGLSFGVYNSCGADVFVGEARFPYGTTSPHYFYFSVVKDSDKTYATTSSEYKPTLDDKIEISIKVGNEESILSFIEVQK